ncbi:hypothetical protein ACFX13_038542 [Malus domestica]
MGDTMLDHKSSIGNQPKLKGAMVASGCVGMHSVTTTTPQRDGGGEADVIAGHYIEELPSALIGAWSVSSEVIRSRSSLRYKKLPFTRMDTQTFCSFIYSKP